MEFHTALAEVEQLLLQHVPITIGYLKPGESGYATYPDYQICIESNSKRVQVIYEDIIIASSTETLIVRESFHIPAFYIPLKDVRTDLMKRSCCRTYCPFKGYGTYWSLTVEQKTIENAALSYEKLFDEVSVIKEHITFNWKQFDYWYKEGEDLLWDISKPIWIGKNH